MVAQSRLPAAVRDLVTAGWHVEAEGKLFRNPNSVSLHLSSGIDWFELHGSIEFGESRITVPKLLAALRRHESTILLDDGSYGMLPEEWLEKYGMLAGLGTAHGDHVRFNRNQAGLLDALLASRPEVSCDELFERVRTELQTFAGNILHRTASGISRQPSPLSMRGIGMAPFSAAVPLRRLPGGRHGTRQNHPGAGAARGAPRAARRKPLPPTVRRRLW